MPFNSVRACLEDSKKAPPERKDFPRSGTDSPRPGRNVTAGDKERNRCRASDKKGNGWHRISDDERSFY